MNNLPGRKWRVIYPLFLSVGRIFSHMIQLAEPIAARGTIFIAIAQFTTDNLRWKSGAKCDYFYAISHVLLKINRFCHTFFWSARKCKQVNLLNVKYYDGILFLNNLDWQTSPSKQSFINNCHCDARLCYKIGFYVLWCPILWPYYFMQDLRMP